MAAGCITGFNIPGVTGSLTIAHSALGGCGSYATSATKVVEANLYGSFSFESLRSGITINIFFSETNKIYNDNLKLQLATPHGNITTPIISNMLDAGSNGTGNTEVRGASFSYPRQDKWSIVTFVYQPLKCQVQNNSQGVDDHYTENAEPYYVQQAIGVQSIPIYKGSLADDFNNYLAEGAYTIGDFNKTNSFTTSATYGILEVIKVADVYLIQRATQADGTMFQRFCLLSSPNVQSNQQAITSTAVIPSTSENPEGGV